MNYSLIALVHMIAMFFKIISVVKKEPHGKHNTKFIKKQIKLD